jgi:predicted GH43/DUF377 family glycosyl hydrolase
VRGDFKAHFQRYGKLSSSSFPDFCCHAVTTVDVLDLDDVTLMFFGGHDGKNERLGLALPDKLPTTSIPAEKIRQDPVVDIGEPGSFDSTHVTDPAAAYHDDTIFLYYSGIGDQDDAIGLATSTDGKTFTKYSVDPILSGRSPEIVIKDSVFHLFYVLPRDEGYAIYLATSDDGYEFKRYSDEPIVTPSESGWDSLTVTTPRIFEYDGLFWMLFAGDDETMDYPKGFGLAYSDDLVSWSKYEANPIFERGTSSAWDGTAIWFGTVYEHKGEYLMFYEGCSGDSECSNPRSHIGIAQLVDGSRTRI